MGFFDLFKKKSSNEVNIEDGSKNEKKPTVIKLSGQIRYEFVFKGADYGLDENDKCFENKPCFSSKFYDDSDSTDCAFCNKVMSLDRLWSRTEIQDLTKRLKYDVFANPGGKIDENGNPNCSCMWKSVIAMKRNSIK